MTEHGLSAPDAAAKQGVSAVTARKWLGRFLVDGAAGLLNKSSRPDKSPRAIVELRQKLFLQAHMSSYRGVSKATASRVAFSQIYPDESRHSAQAFMRARRRPIQALGRTCSTHTHGQQHVVPPRTVR